MRLSFYTIILVLILAGNITAHAESEVAHQSEQVLECVSPPELLKIVELTQDEKTNHVRLVIRSIQPLSGRVEHSLISGTEKISSKTSSIKSGEVSLQVIEFSRDQKSAQDIWIRSRVIQSDGTVTMSVDQRIIASATKAVLAEDSDALVPVMFSRPDGSTMIEHLSKERAEQLRGKETVLAIGQNEIDAAFPQKVEDEPSEEEAAE